MIDALVLYAGLVIARVATFVSVLPLFGGGNVPRVLKVGLALALSLMYLVCMAPSIPAQSPLATAGVEAWLPYGLVLGREILLGAVLGYLFNLILLPARIAGEFLSQGLGLTFGNLLNPLGEVQTNPLATIFEALAIFLFLGIDGHHTFFAVLHASFSLYPIGTDALRMPSVNLVNGLDVAQQYGIVLVAPVALCLFLTTVSLSLLTRAAPQLNIYSVGFPLQLSAGLASILLFLPNLLTTLVASIGRMTEIVLHLV